MKLNVIVCNWIAFTILSSSYADNERNNSYTNQQIYLHEEYYNVSKHFYIDNSWNEYLSEVYNEPSSSYSSSLKHCAQTLIHQYDNHHHHHHHHLCNKNRIQIYYKNAKIRLHPFNWENLYLHSTRYGKFDTLPSKYRAGFISSYIVPSNHWIEVHRFSTHLLYGEDKLEGYSDVTHTTGICIVCMFICIPDYLFILYLCRYE
jgi:hypothetical protein